ncbi:ATP-binding protein [Rhodobacteraceae bacterium M385]|nr:ATP-binding protein [Rhodobacteraceae bacterium M385]
MTHTKAPDVFQRFQSGTVQVRHALDRARDDVRAAQVDSVTCDTSQIILGEVLNNVVEHAYGFEEGHPIEMSIWLRDDGLWCEILDHGGPMPDGIAPAGRRAQFDPENRQELPEGGFGWAMVRELTQDLNYRRANDTNELVFLIPHTQP